MGTDMREKWNGQGGCKMELLEICKQAKEVKQQIAALSTNQKNDALCAVADKLVACREMLIEANVIDLENGRKNQMPEGLLDRLLLSEARIGQMAEGLAGGGGKGTPPRKGFP